jgi:hypothetical protein
MESSQGNGDPRLCGTRLWWVRAAMPGGLGMKEEVVRQRCARFHGDDRSILGQEGRGGEAVA